MPELAPDAWTRAAVEQSRRWLTAYLLVATGHHDAADDLVQEAFRIAFEKRATFRVGAEFGPWLRGIARNCLKRHFEAVRRRPVLMGDALEELEASAAEAEPQRVDPLWVERRLAALRSCLKALTRRARRIMEERFMRRLPSAQVASRLGMTVGAVNASVFRSRGALADCVQRRLEP